MPKNKHPSSNTVRSMRKATVLLKEQPVMTVDKVRTNK